MSNKLIKEPRASGREQARKRPSFISASGYVFQYRHLAPETLPRLEAAVRIALAESKPAVPTQRVETGPDQWSDVPNPHDEAYQQALEQWEAAVREEQGRRFLTLCEQYALIYEIDQEEVDALRAVHRAIGDPLDDLSDAHIFLWRVALPTADDQMSLYGKLFGGLTEEAIQAQKASFLGQLQGPAAPSSA